MIELKKLTGKRLVIVLPDVGLTVAWLVKHFRNPRKHKTGGEYHTEIQCKVDLNGDVATESAFCSVTEPKFLLSKGRKISLERALAHLALKDRALRAHIWTEILKVLPPPPTAGGGPRRG